MQDTGLKETFCSPDGRDRALDIVPGIDEAPSEAYDVFVLAEPDKTDPDRPTRICLGSYDTFDAAFGALCLETARMLDQDPENRSCYAGGYRKLTYSGNDTILVDFGDPFTLNSIRRRLCPAYARYC